MEALRFETFPAVLGLVALFAGVIAPVKALAGVIADQLWKTKSIPFVICSSIEPDKSDMRKCAPMLKLGGTMTQMVRNGVAEWNRTFAGHIEFREVRAFAPGVVRIVASKEPGACSASQVGYVPGADPLVSFGTTCAFRPVTPPGTILHELAHIVGLHHEQRRPDRDQLLVVDRDLLTKAAKSSKENWGWAFQYTRLCDVYSTRDCLIDFKLPDTPVSLYSPAYGAMSGDYDFTSVMHYPLFPPTRSGNSPAPLVDVTTEGALRLRQQNYNIFLIGQRDRLSPGDIDTIKHFYPRT